MADFFKTGFWSGKKEIVIPPRDTFNYVKGLDRNSFQENKAFISMLIIDEKGNEVGHCELGNIISFSLIENTIVVNTIDKQTITYVFVSWEDARLANDKLNNLINGL